MRQDSHCVLIPDDLLHCGQGSDDEYVLAAIKNRPVSDGFSSPKTTLESKDIWEEVLVPMQIIHLHKVARYMDGNGELMSSMYAGVHSIYSQNMVMLGAFLN